MAADYDLQGVPFAIATVAVNTVKKISFSGDYYTIRHMLIQDDGATPSSATDQLIVMAEKDAMAASLADGSKSVLIAAIGLHEMKVYGRNVKAGDDSPHEIQIEALGHGCKVAIFRDQQPKDA